MNDRHVATENIDKIVLHWAGCVTDEVFSFLGPTSAALAKEGVKQTVVLMDEPRYKHLQSRFAPSVSLVLTPPATDKFGHWKKAQQTFINELQRTSPSIVHLHGFIPYVLGARAVNRYARAAHVYYSPHGSRSLKSSSKGWSTLASVVHRLIKSNGARNIANILTDARALESTGHQPATLLESVIPHEFFDASRNEARYPLIVTGNRIPDFASANTFAQLAVLLSEESLRASFNWIGACDAPSESCLTAANVGVVDLIDDADRARRLAAAWAFAAPTGKSGFPLFLAEAMAVGLPCVAIDTRYHRDLIEDGVTGYLCADESEMVARIAQLVDSPSLRASMGDAARTEARARFSDRRFQESMNSSSY